MRLTRRRCQSPRDPAISGSVSDGCAEPFLAFRSARPVHHSDSERHSRRHDPRARRFRADADLRHHGRGEFRPWRIVHARRLYRRCHCCDDRQLLAGADRLGADRRADRRRLADRDLAAADRARSAQHDPRHVRRLAHPAEFRAVGIRPDGAAHSRAARHLIHPVLPAISLVSPVHCGFIRRHHHRLLAFSQTREVRRLDPCHGARSHHGASDGNPGAAGLYWRVCHRRGHGGCKRRIVRALGRRQPHDGARLGAEGLHRRGCRRHGQSRRLDRCGDLHQSPRILCHDLGRSLAGRDCVLRRADPHAAVSSHRFVRIDAQMTTVPLEKVRPLGKARLSHTAVFWIGFCAIMALLIVAPLVLPEFWRRFLTEILIWGLLAMSSDLLIGYTGMISFGHSAFFGLGMYGAAGALIAHSPPNLWLALFFGLAGAAGAALFVAFFSTRLRDIYFAITTLIFSQIFYVIIFTWTPVTGGENGLIFSRPHLWLPFLYDARFTSTTMHWFVLAVVAASYLFLRRITQSPFGMVLQSIRENEARTRAIGYAVERYKMVSVMFSGLFAGLAGVLYALQNQFAAPDFVYFLTSGDTVIYNVMGGIGTLVGPIVGAGFFQLVRDLLSRFFGDQFPYLIPLGMIFIVMIIFLPQGLLGFARRWLNK